MKIPPLVIGFLMFVSFLIGLGCGLRAGYEKGKEKGYKEAGDLSITALKQILDKHLNAEEQIITKFKFDNDSSVYVIKTR